METNGLRVHSCCSELTFSCLLVICSGFNITDESILLATPESCICPLATLVWGPRECGLLGEGDSHPGNTLVGAVSRKESANLTLKHPTGDKRPLEVGVTRGVIFMISPNNPSVWVLLLTEGHTKALKCEVSGWQSQPPQPGPAC